MSVRKIFETMRAYRDNPLSFIKHDTLRVERGEVRASVQELSEILDREELGAGSFSKVFLINDKLVLKVSCNRLDMAYQAFADFVSRHQSNPYLPRIYYQSRTGICRFYIMERLVYAGYDVPFWMENMHAFRRALADGSVRREAVDPNILTIVDWMNNCGFQDDTGGGNIMKREDGTFVLTDPVC